MKKNNQDQLVPSISESTEGGFSQRSTHLRSMRKAERALPKSPRKSNAVQKISVTDHALNKQQGTDKPRTGDG